MKTAEVGKLGVGKLISKAFSYRIFNPVGAMHFSIQLYGSKNCTLIRHFSVITTTILQSLALW